MYIWLGHLCRFHLGMLRRSAVLLEVHKRVGYPAICSAPALVSDTFVAGVLFNSSWLHCDSSANARTILASQRYCRPEQHLAYATKAKASTAVATVDFGL